MQDDFTLNLAGLLHYSHSFYILPNLVLGLEKQYIVIGLCVGGGIVVS